MTSGQKFYNCPFVSYKCLNISLSFSCNFVFALNLASQAMYHPVTSSAGQMLRLGLKPWLDLAYATYGEDLEGRLAWQTQLRAQKFTANSTES